jgi:hypothetical protein
MGLVSTLILSLLAPVQAEAQASTALEGSAEVIQVRGNRAMIRLPQGVRFNVGDTIALAPKSSAPAPAAQAGQRQTAGGVALLSFLNDSEASGTVTTIAISGQYGWNDGLAEYGPVAQVENRSLAGRSQTTVQMGGWMDYNLIPNDGESDLVYGVGGELRIGQLTQTAESSQFLVAADAGLVAKWFIFSGQPTALRLESNFSLMRVGSINRGGLDFRAGLQFYF